MRKTRFMSIILVMVTLVCFAFSGCEFASVFDTGIEGLMQPPMTDEEKYQIKLLLDTLVDGTVTLCTPKAGKYRMACTEYDIDREVAEDGTMSDEAIVFYQQKLNGVTKLYIHVFRKENGKWISVREMDALGNDIYSFEIFDLNRDGTDEIIVLWENEDSKDASKTLAVYEYEGKNIKFGGELQCEDMTIVDLKSGGNYEIVTVSLNVTEHATVAKAYVHDYGKHGFVHMGNSEGISLDSQVLGFAGIVSSTVAEDEDEENNNENKPKLFSHVMIDCYYQSYNQLMTEVIYWPKNLLENTYVDTPDKFRFDESDNFNTRLSATMSCDKNNDGIIDIPTLEKFADFSADYKLNESGEAEKFIVAWRTFDTQLFTTIYTVENSEFNYTLTIPGEWFGDIALRDNSSKNEYVFYKWDAENDKSLGVYFKVRVFKASDWKKNETIYTGMLDYNYEKIATNDAGTLVYAWSKGDYGMPKELAFSLNQ